MIVDLIMALVSGLAIGWGLHKVFSAKSRDDGDGPFIPHGILPVIMQARQLDVGAQTVAVRVRSIWMEELVDEMNERERGFKQFRLVRIGEAFAIRRIA